jgi:FAD/FMN-containing dehydrogenase
MEVWDSMEIMHVSSDVEIGRSDELRVLADISTAADVEANDIFGANVKKLEDLKHKYDPNNLFSHGTRLTPRPLVVVN